MSLSKKNVAESEVETTETEALEGVLEAEVEAVEQPQPTEVAAHTQQLPAESNNRSTAVTELSESGFGGLEIDWTSFPTVVLDNGEFGTSDGQTLDTKEITVQLMQSRKRYVLRTNAIKDEDAELAYTYDMSELDDPSSDLSKKVIQWREQDGLSYKIKEYIEALAIVQDDESSLNQQMVLLQIPPTSVGRFSGFTTQNLLIQKLKPTEYLTRCHTGPKVTKAVKPFVPWAFELASKL